MDNYNKNKFRRKRIRLENYDYSSDGAYFITICIGKNDISLWETVAANCVRQSVTPELSVIENLLIKKSKKLKPFMTALPLINIV